MKTVYLNDHISENAVNRLKQHVRLVDNFDHPEEIDAIIVRQQYCTAEIIEKVKNCKLIQMHGVGLERIDLEAAQAAGMDVFECQPPKPDNPLLSLDNFIGTLHIGGSTAEALERNGQIVVENVFKALGIEE